MCMVFVYVYVSVDIFMWLIKFYGNRLYFGDALRCRHQFASEQPHSGSQSANAVNKEWNKWNCFNRRERKEWISEIPNDEHLKSKVNVK